MNRSNKVWNAMYWCVLLAAVVCTVVRLLGLAHSLPTAYLKDDFNHYYATAVLLSTGQIPYGIPLSGLQLGAAFKWNEFTPMATNPPVLAMLTEPLAFMAPNASWMIWESLVIVSLMLCFGLMLRELQPKLSGKTIVLFCLMATSSAAAARLVEHGQVQSIILLSVILGWIAARRNSWLASAALWGFAAAIKIYAWPLLLILLRKDLKTFFFGVCSAGVVSVLPVFLYGTGVYTGFAASAMPLLQDAF
ncbi:MAG: DUF2029 domain-containing protein, partial [Bdellovibrionales bacterium]|nr:DUF2029 domain-containing protein [Bdellovibrionales bacterium]